MSDNMRKDFSSQVHDKAKPDSQKTYTESATDTVTGAADKVGAALQPEGEKSTTQKIGDSTRGHTDGAQDSGASLVDQAQNTFNDAAQYVADTVVAATDALKGKSQDAKAEADKSTST